MPQQDDVFRKRVVYEVPGMDAVEIRRDVVYGRAEDGDLTMDVYLPPGLGDGERRPGVVFLHGGPVPTALWPRVNRMGVFLSYGELLAASGLVAATVNHRFISLPGIAASAANVAAALGHLRDDAAALRLDPDRLCLWVFSGGGPLLVPYLREKTSWVRALIAYYAILDLAPMREHMDPAVPDEIVRAWSPVGCFAPGPYQGPPLLVARAGRDTPWMSATCDRFVAAAVAANAPLDFFNHPEGQHGFDILNDDDRTREILARTLAFVKSRV